jgi:hypothetical protein
VRKGKKEKSGCLIGGVRERCARVREGESEREVETEVCKREIERERERESVC